MTGSRAFWMVVVAALVSIGSIPARSAPAGNGIDPWPTWQRTNSRLGRTEHLGPRTPTLDWKLRVDPHPIADNGEYRITLDSKGFLYIGVTNNLASVDSAAKTIRWLFHTVDSVFNAPLLSRDDVFFGTASGDNATFYCLLADTGEENWRYVISPGTINTSPVMDDNDVVHFSTGKTMYALNAEDGSEVWTRTHRENIHGAPSLDGQGRRFDFTFDNNEFRAHDITDGEPLWQLPVTGYTRAALIPESGRLYGAVYAGNRQNRNVYCVDSTTGAEIWRTPVSWTATEGVALGSPESNLLFATPGGSDGKAYCFDTRDGRELWATFADLAFDPPVVDGENTIYFGVISLPHRIFAIKADGVILWTYPMPENVFGSPILAPDGTLYVMCSDKYLYAFRDPAGDLNYDQRIDLADYASFDTCMTAPRLWGTRVNTAPGCELLDFDRDWDVDLADYAAFQNAFGTAIP